MTTSVRESMRAALAAWDRDGVVPPMSESFVKDLTAEKREKTVTKTDSIIKIKQETVEAYDELQKNLKGFLDVAKPLMIPHAGEVALGTRNVFDARKADVYSNTEIAASSYLTVTPKDSSEIRHYDLTISSVAQRKVNHSNSFASRTANAVETAQNGGNSSPFFLAGDFYITSSGVVTTISVAMNDSIEDIVKQINAKASKYVTASITQVGSSDFRITIKALKSGTANSFTISDTGHILPKQFEKDVVAAADASFTFDGITITRSDNTIDDLVDNLTIKLYQKTPVQTIIGVDIIPDLVVISEAISHFVGAYNNFMKFAAIQQERHLSTNYEKGYKKDDYTETARLGKETNFYNIYSSILSVMQRILPNIKDGEMDNVAKLGFTFTINNDAKPPIKNYLNVDPTILLTAIQDKFNEVKRLFGFAYERDNADLLITDRAGDYNFNTMKITLDTTLPYGSQVSTTIPHNDTSPLNPEPLSYNNLTHLLEGIPGGMLTGMKLSIFSNQTTTIFSDLTQGYASRLVWRLDSYTDESVASPITMQKKGQIPATMFLIKQEIDLLYMKRESQEEDLKQFSDREYTKLGEAVAKINRAKMENERIKMMTRIQYKSKDD